MGNCTVTHPSLGQCCDGEGHEGPHSTPVVMGTCWWGDNPQHDEDYEHTPNRCVEVTTGGKYVIRLNVPTPPSEVS